jgi:hypothetical protein
VNGDKISTPPLSTDKVLIFICAVGALLRLFQYHAGTSLWGDELSIVRNATSKDLFSLVAQPLSDDQVAPFGFLFLLKLIVNFAGTSEYALRFIPLLCSLISLPLFASLARKVLPRGEMLAALLFFSTSPPLIRYAAQVKPYSSDLLASLMCLLTACWWLEEISGVSSLWAAAAGAMVIWFSYPSVFVLVTIGLLALGRGARRSASCVKRVTAVLASWLLSGALVAVVEFHRWSAGTQAYMQTFWADWMLPRVLSFSDIGTWLLRVLQDWFRDFLHLPTWPAMCVLLVIGVYFLVRYSTVHAALLLGPLLLTFGASLARYYPFRGRVILFLVPNVLILLAAGLLALTRAASRAAIPPSGQRAVLLVAALIMGARPLWKNPPPYRNSETKPVLYYLGQQRRDGDAIYIHNMAWHAYEFYGPRFSLAMNEARISSLKGNKTGPNPLVILHDLDEFRGRRRLWVVLGGGYDQELTATVWYLDTIGRRLDCKSAYNAAVYLYDLSDPELLQSAKADDLFAATPHTKDCETSVNP